MATPSASFPCTTARQPTAGADHSPRSLRLAKMSVVDRSSLGLGLVARTCGALVLVGALGSMAACSAPGKGALILAISTDMQAPKDIDVVSLYIETGGVPKFDYLGRVLPDGTVSLPSTLAVVEPDDPSAQVRIRITVFKTQPDGSAQARVVRDVLTTVPHQRTAMFRLPLNFLDDGSAAGTLPAMYVPNPNGGVPEGDTSYGPTDPVPTDTGYITTTCDFSQGLTSVAGTCVNANFDSSAAPDYEEEAVFGDGGTPDTPACFHVDQCFAARTLVQPSTVTMNSDGSCSFALTQGEDGQDWNCALQTADGTGTCIGPNGGPPCLVPLESDPGEGFTINPGQSLSMVPGVCKKLFPTNGKPAAQLYLDKTSCATKVEAAPVCQPIPTSAGGPADAAAPVGDSGAAPEDAGAFPDAGVTAGGGSDASTTADGGLAKEAGEEDAGAPADAESSGGSDGGTSQCPTTVPLEGTNCSGYVVGFPCSYPTQSTTCTCDPTDSGVTWSCLAS